MKISCLVFFAFSSFFSWAQKIGSTYYSISTSFQQSVIKAQRAPAMRFGLDHPWQVQMDFGVLKTSSQAWSYCNCYSQNGLSLTYINFDNPANLGHAFAATGFIEPYLLTYKHFLFSLKASAGIAFLDKVYDKLANPDNIFVSQKLSFMLGFGAQLSYRINEHVIIKTGLHLNHISNGGGRDPNDGLNFYGYQAGVQYSLRPYQLFSLMPQSNERFSRRDWRWMVHVFGNQRTAWATTATQPDLHKAVFGLNLGFIKRIGRLNGIGAGGEYVYDGINEVKQQRLNIPMNTDVAAVSLQHYLFFGKLLFGQQLGVYITPNPGYSNTFFERYILEYEFVKNWYAGFTLKSHEDKSDYFAFSTGYFLKYSSCFGVTPHR